MKRTLSLRGMVSAAVTIVAMSTNAALATLPADQYAEFSIREDPTDEDSNVVFVYRLHLKAITSNETSVAWEVTQADFEEIGAGGIVVDWWSIYEPEVISDDGLWWVNHAKLSEPETAEFNAPPSIAGTANYQGTGRGDLDYALFNGALAPGYQTMYGGNVSALTHSVQVVSEQDPIVEGDDEPAEILGGRDGVS